MNHKIFLLMSAILLTTGCSNSPTRSNMPVQDKRTTQYFDSYKEEARSFFEKHPEYMQDHRKEVMLFSEFSKLLANKKYRNLSLSQLLEMAYENIQQ